MINNIVELNPIIVKEWVDWEPLHDSDCEGCFKKEGYGLRSNYLTEWVTKYIENETDIVHGKMIMPNFMWSIPDSANLQSLFKYHETKDKGCPWKLSDCKCRVAFFIRILWRLDSKYLKSLEDQKKDICEYSVDQIVGRFINLKNKELKKLKMI